GGGEQRLELRPIISVGGRMAALRRIRCPLEPLAAGSSGDGQKGSPVVRLSVVDAGRHYGVSRPDADRVVLRPAGDFPGQDAKMVDAVDTKLLDPLSWQRTTHFNHHRPVVQFWRQLLKEGDRHGRIGRERSRLIIIPDRYITQGLTAPTVPIVEDGKQFQV